MSAAPPRPPPPRCPPNAVESPFAAATVAGKFYARDDESRSSAAAEEAERRALRRVRDMFERGPRDEYPEPALSSHEWVFGGRNGVFMRIARVVSDNVSWKHLSRDTAVSVTSVERFLEFTESPLRETDVRLTDAIFRAAIDRTKGQLKLSPEVTIAQTKQAGPVTDKSQ